MADRNLRLEHTAWRIAVGGLAAAALTIGAAAAIWAVGVIDQWRFEQTDPSAIIEYERVEFVRQDGDHLIMASTFEWKQAAPMVEWLDQLICDPDNPRLVSHQYEKGSKPEPERKIGKQWDYKGSLPAAADTCQMRSEITATIRGVHFQQRVRSDWFTVEP